MTNDHSLSSSKPVRVRMAPSPTGFFHVGSARTALFNYLFAKHNNGTFVLRVEDTDTQRNDPEYEKIIYDAMAWLGLDADEGPKQGGEYGPYRQSERFELYREYAQKLIEAGTAYYAYETADELTAMKAEQAAQKQPPRYNGAHRELTVEQRAAFEAEGRKPVIRFRVPEGTTAWPDVVRGEVSWNNKELDDFVIGKSDGSPTYNFACVLDDALMKISHVIRGEDGLSNTPRQILIYQALGFETPLFAHLPFLLGRDRSKLSKRHGAVNLLDFDTQGILPDAMFNYLALLGWNPGGGETQEIFTRDELIEKFTLEGVNKAGAIFDIEKLQWVNTQLLKAMPVDKFIELAHAQLKDIPGFGEDAGYTHRAVELARERIHGVSDIRNGATYFFSDDYEVDPAGVAKHLTETSLPKLKQLRDRLEALTEWNHDSVEGAIRTLASDLGIKPAELIHPSRMAVSGRTVGPSVFELLAALGRERVLRRMARVVEA
ncbi:MAG TPA: glutamate--tRNA ligase [Abditibacteriaceae bacterium]|jgi:glutamyl-tRNA synthetase